VDTITQFALGATIGEAGWGPRVGRKAALVGGLCGILPDMDFLLAVGDAWTRLQVHRGSSHSILVLPFVALGLGFLAWRLAKKEATPWMWVHLCLWALVTHPLLDTCTAYGTQLLAPLSRERFAIDNVGIIDLFYSIPLFVITFRALRKKAYPDLQRHARIVLAVTTGYLVAGLGQSWLAESRAEDALDQHGFAAERLRATPTVLNNVLFRVVARDAEGNIAVGLSSTFAGSDVELVTYPMVDDPLVDAALASREGEIFAWFADDFVHARITKHEDGRTTVHLDDMRYGSVADPAQTVFGADFVFDASGNLESAERVNRRDIDAGRELVALGRGIVGQL